MVFTFLFYPPFSIDLSFLGVFGLLGVVILLALYLKEGLYPSGPSG
jgi:hypothetical protein